MECGTGNLSVWLIKIVPLYNTPSGMPNLIFWIVVNKYLVYSCPIFFNLWAPHKESTILADSIYLIYGKYSELEINITLDEAHYLPLHGQPQTSPL